MKNFILFIVCISCHYYLSAQCSSGEVEVEIEINTDSYASEGYWELVSSDSMCGQGTILSGGNAIVGCSGGGLQNQPSGGYGPNTTINSGTACLVEGASYRIAYADDWGDGGFEFFVYINGYLVAEFEGSGSFEYFSFDAIEPPPYDLIMLHAHVAKYQPQGDVDIEAEVYNAGTTTISSVDLTYSIDGGSAITQTISGLSISNGARAHLTHPVAWSATADGEYELAISHNNLNGTNLDENPNNDEVETIITIGPGRPNVIDSYLINLPVVVEIADGSEQINMPTDLDFHPVLSRNELWVLNKDLENTGSSTVTITNAGESNQDEQWLRDGNAWHFMSLSTGIVFSENGNFATSPGVYDANHNGGQAFTGPALWSSDLTIYAQPSGGNGSHLDMLHESPECQGIAHETENVFWVFDGYNRDIVRYDFAADHGPGNDDHSDGEVLRFSEEKVRPDSDDKIVSHLAYDKTTDWLYVVDHGNERVFRIDTKSGTQGGSPSYGPFEPLAVYRNVVDYNWEELVDSGLYQPAGIALMEDYMLVSDYFTGEIIIYDISTAPASELKRLSLEAEGIMGITIGPAGKIWYVDYEDESVNRIDWVADTTVGIAKIPESDMKIYPNPCRGNLTIEKLSSKANSIEIINIQGQIVFESGLNEQRSQFKLNLPPGAYYIKAFTNSHLNEETSKLIIK